jgi:predicted nuclease with TOPRIM domain
MRPHGLQSAVRYPQVSTMPKAQTQAAAYLSLYKVVTEKRRLLQELEAVEVRRDRILNRLAILETQMAHLETTANNLNETVSNSQSAQGGSFKTLFLEY